MLLIEQSMRLYKIDKIWRNKWKNWNGKIHSIETFGAVDGPGIRFVVFMQGCILRCKYCHNRDTWDIKNSTDVSVFELVEKIKKYKDYIFASNGGVTITGGEPLLQVDFLTSLFKELKEEGFHTAIDTSRYGQYYR